MLWYYGSVLLIVNFLLMKVAGVVLDIIRH